MFQGMASGSRDSGEAPGTVLELHAGVPYSPPLDELLPLDGQDTVTVVEGTVAELATFWSPFGLADAAAALSCLGFLAHEAERRLWDAVADARQQGCSWEEIASRLCREAGGVEQRYAAYAQCRKAEKAIHQSRLLPPQAREAQC
jgi:hypothetical protein